MNDAPTATAGADDDRLLIAFVGAVSVVAVTVESARRYVAKSMGQPPGRGVIMPAADVVIGVAVDATARAVPVGRLALRVFRPVARYALHPPLVPERLQPISWLQARGRDGRAYRGRVSPVVAEAVPAVAAAILDRIDLTSIVVERVDIGRVLDEVDVASIVDRVDIDAVVARLDVDSIVSRVDLDAVARRLDIDAILDRVDIGAVVARVDVDSIVSRVDLDAVARRLDIDAILDRLDLAAIARQIIDDIDLPEIIRESTGSMASEAVVGARIQGIRADEGVNRAVDKLLLRRGERRTQADGDDDSG